MGRIEVTDEAGIAVVSLLGEHDLSTAERFRTEIEGLLDSGWRIVVDLTQTGFVDSTVVAGVVEGHRRVSAEGRDHDLAAVVTPNTAPQRTWKLLRLHERVPTFLTRREAITAMNRDC
jgi:anti-anti-sigma factor